MDNSIYEKVFRARRKGRSMGCVIDGSGKRGINRQSKKVVDSALCTGCGTCVSMCPQSAIKLRIDGTKGVYFPEIDLEKCCLCRICYQVCPGHSVYYEQLIPESLGQKSYNVMIGNYYNCYVGYSNDMEIRHNSASNG